MTIRLTLIAATGPVRRGTRLGQDEPLGERGLAQARAAAAALPSTGRHYTAPAVRCLQTAEALGLTAQVEQALEDCDLGNWRGRTLDELIMQAPEALAAWTTDPSAAPHGGESVDHLCDRVGAWLNELPSDTGRAIAVTVPSVIRAAVVHALVLPRAAFWRIDVPPLAFTRLTSRAGQWNLRLG